MNQRGSDSGNPGDPHSDDIARDRFGRPILDRFGRPVQKRPNTKMTEPPRRRPRREDTGASASPVHDSPRQQPQQFPNHTQQYPGLGQQPRQPYPGGAQQPRQQYPAPGQQTRQPYPGQQPPQQYQGQQYQGQQYPGQPQRLAPGQRPGQRPVPGQRPTQPGRPLPPLPPQPPARAAAAEPPRRRRGLRLPKFGCLRSVLTLVLVVFLLFAGAFLWADTKLTRVEAMPTEQIADTSGKNWLLVGSDSRQGLSEEEAAKLNTGGDIGIGRTDTIMLLHIPTTGKPTLLSIPRDSYVSIPGYGMEKVNAAFTYGGPQLLTQTVEQSTGIHIDHYAEIGLGGFSSMVDAVGKVEICVDEPIADDVINLYLDAGCQKMDGPTALSYVRTRATPMGDLDRVERQRKFFAALMDKATNPETLLNPFRTLSLISETGSAFIVGDKDHSWHLARMAWSIRKGLDTETIPLGGFADTEVGSVVLWDEAATEAMLSEMR